jgi:hypothetical protein
VVFCLGGKPTFSAGLRLLGSPVLCPLKHVIFTQLFINTFVIGCVTVLWRKLRTLLRIAAQAIRRGCQLCKQHQRSNMWLQARANKEQLLQESVYRSYSDARPVAVIVYHSDVMWPYYTLSLLRHHSHHHSICFISPRTDSDTGSISNTSNIIFIFNVSGQSGKKDWNKLEYEFCFAMESRRSGWLSG